MSLVLPTEIDFMDWSRSLYIDLPHLQIPLALSEDAWKEWAVLLCDLNQLSPNIPIPYTYDDWREWAHYFLQNSSSFQ